VGAKKTQEKLGIHEYSDERIELICKPEIDKFNFNEAGKNLANKHRLKPICRRLEAN
jgi:hypothetical protein